MAAQFLRWLRWAVLLGSSACWCLPFARGDEPAELFWSFRKLDRPALPRVKNVGRARTPVDFFVLAKLEAKGLTFAPDADPIMLVRRVFFDVIGLPPALDEVDAFLNDTAPGAYERLIDRLLASPHFGERWGRRWLDAAGYVDTVGFDIDLPNVMLGAGKWKYRDYVIRAFNLDRPYDRFVAEQLAGDEMVNWREATKFTPEIRELLIATGFLRTAEDDSHEPESNIPSVHYAVLHDTLEIVGSNLLGLTLNCARCHTHKFDPIPQEDYYRLMAVFTPAYNPKAWKPVYPWKPEIKDRALADVSPAELAEIERHNKEIDEQVAASNKKLAELRRPYELRLQETKLATISEPIRADTKAALATPTERRTAVQMYLADKFAALLKVTPEEVKTALSEPDRAAERELTGRIAAANARRRTFDKIQALYDVGPPPPTHLLKRGNLDTPGPEVKPGYLSVLCDSPTASVMLEAKTVGPTSGRRTALAKWLTDPQSRASALLARVIVNRIWQHLFGQGIVASPDNFGRLGERPTHPELLEWLSSEFVRNGWRIKPLIRLMMTSTAYRQGARIDADESRSRTVDPDNQLLWRARLRRLDAEIIRDSILAVSGKLDRTMGGPPIPQEAHPDGMVIVSEKDLANSTTKYRRSIYMVMRRKYPLTLLRVFDQPTVATNCTRRDASAVALQSLTMLNDPFLLEQAGHLAARVAHGAGDDRGKQIDLAFRLVLARRPGPKEATWCAEHLEKQAAVYRAAKLPTEQVERSPLTTMCHTLLNTSEFLYAEGPGNGARTSRVTGPVPVSGPGSRP
ncbi:MAG TPA: DUF1549 and DUF1553 domain-containing protein [Gemmataceae bacterium]|nr:DUF1549 and DUF1553 domain-containing protein [Gemmataceae bacterium]